MPDDLTACQQIIRELHDALHRSRQEVEKLEHRLDELLKWRFGPKADRLDPNQLALFATEVLEQIQPPPAPAPKPSRPAQPARNGHGRRPSLDDLPHEPKVHDLSEAEKLCPCCGQMREPIGAERSRQLEHQPARLYVIEHIRPTYACKHCQGNVETASKPLQPIEKGLAGPGLLAAVITAKYGDHLPLYRQEDIFGRAGHAIPRSTTCGWLASCAALVAPLYEHLKALVLASAAINTDDTRVPVLDPRRGKTREGHIWVYVGDRRHPYIVFDYTPTHCREGPAKFLENFTGYIQADGYSGYDQLFVPKPDGTASAKEVGCWAHARRKFVEAERSDTLRSHTAVALIKLLYEVEREAKDLSDESRRALRQEKSAPRLAQIKEWLEAQRPMVLPQSPMAEAIGYCLNRWAAMERYVLDGRLAIDNNAAENALRPIVVGRKNWLFAGSDNGGRTGAVLASLVASCKRHGVDPYAYLKDMLTRIASTPVSQLDQFLPDQWKAAHAATVIPVTH